ncbi:MAG: sugar transferase [Deltaproteobacteria bacterium]|nr:sugar transferase [Deltaproteobacteria bacterium]
MNLLIIRGLDILLSVIGILITSPFWILIAIAIRLESKGPAFFVQERLGINQIPFNMIKFRTMRLDAESGGPVWSKQNDPRITRLGFFLRKSRLDELPQLWNILKNDISFVGPRPIRKHFADLLAKEAPEYNQRFLVKPGLTGWAQLYAPYGADTEDQLKKLPYDLRYLKGLSVFSYFKLIFLTLFKFSDSSGV